MGKQAHPIILACQCSRVNRLGERLKLFAWLEAHSFAWRDADFRACPGIAADASLPGFDVENTKSAQLNAVALGKGSLHGLEHRLDSHLGFGLGDASAVDDLIDNVQLYHANLLKIQALILKSGNGIVKNFLLDYDAPPFCFLGGTEILVPQAATVPYTRGYLCPLRTIVGFERWPQSTT
jgi:hypothetical protein